MKNYTSIHLETYRKVMLPLVMPPFHYGKVQVQFGSAFEFGTHRNEEQSEGGQMETDLVVALESHPTKLEATFGIGNIFGTTYLSSNVKGFGPI